MLVTAKVTIGAAGAQPTQFSATSLPINFIIIEADDGNANPCFIGDSAVTSGNGIRLNNSATVPGRVIYGAFPAGQMNLTELYVAGTEDESVNISYVPW